MTNLPDMLNLNFLKVTSINDTKSDQVYYIGADPILSLPQCPSCGNVRPNTIQKFGTKIFTYSDVPIHGKMVVIRVKRQRHRCLECGVTFYEDLRDMDDTHNATNRFIQYVYDQSLTTPFAPLARQLGIHPKTVRNIFDENVKRLESKYKRVIPEQLGIDEIYLLDKAKPICVLTNIGERSVMDLLPDRNLPTLRDYFMKMPGTSKVTAVTMDMWTGYRTLAKEFFPNALIIVDKYHVLQVVDKALDSIRIEARNTFSYSEGKRLFRSRRLLQSRRQHLKDHEQKALNKWLAAIPALDTAYTLKEFFYEIWDAKSKDEAEKLFKEWRGLALESGLKQMIGVSSTVLNWYDEIFNYFGTNLTNAYTESLNRQIRQVSIIGRGYSFPVIRAKIVFAKTAQKPVIKLDKKSFRDGDFSNVLLSMSSDFEEPEYYGSDISILNQLFPPSGEN